MPKKFKIAIVTLSVLLAVSAFSLIAALIYSAVHPSAPAKTVVPNNLITPDTEGATDGSVSGQEPPASGGTVAAFDVATPGDSRKETNADVLYFHNRNTDDNIPFSVKNMFPGDVETKYYCVRVSHASDVTVHYHADIRDGYEKLAEVLRCRIVLLSTEAETVLYDGLMRDMPAALSHLLQTDKATESELYYRIDVYLDTSVGNEYQSKELVADFRWWVEVEETGALTPPQTGDVPMLPYAVTAALSGFFLILLLKKRKKEDADHA